MQWWENVTLKKNCFGINHINKINKCTHLQYYNTQNMCASKVINLQVTTVK